MNAVSTLTFYNPYPIGSQQSKDHWANYVNDATIAKYQVDAIGSFIERNGRDQVLAIEASTSRICGEIEAVESRLRQLSRQQAETNKILSKMDQRMALALEEQRIGNVLLENIGMLLRIPDSQKQRQHHIEMGLKFFNNARKDSDLYQDAVNELLAAEALLPGDYFVLHRIGMLYLYAPPLLNLTKAAEYLLKAGKYAAVESDPEAIRLGNIIQRSVIRSFTAQADAGPAEIGLMAADSYHHAAAAQYALGNFSEAVKMIEKAIAIQPKAWVHSFFKAKYLAAAGQSDAAVEVLRSLSPTTSLVRAVMGDLDLMKGLALAWPEEFESARQRLLGRIKPFAATIAASMAKYPGLGRALAKNEVAQRVLAFAEGAKTSPMELADYVEQTLSNDLATLEKLEAVVELVEEKVVTVVKNVPTGEVKKVPTGEVEKVPTGEVETYMEDVVVRPAGFFRKAIVNQVQRSRPVLVERPVYREEAVVREERRKKAVPGSRSLGFANGFGRVQASLPGHWVELAPSGPFKIITGTPRGKSFRNEPFYASVTISRRFRMLSTLVTPGLYQHLTGKTPPGTGNSWSDETKRENDNARAKKLARVSWLGAIEFCNSFSRTLNLPPAYTVRGDNPHGLDVDWAGLDHPGVRLPTEAEWVYARLRGITGYPDVFGGHSKGHPVYEKEWCQDWFSYDLVPSADPTGSSDPPNPKHLQRRLSRGGCGEGHGDQVDAIRCMNVREMADLFLYKGNDQYPCIGFRCVLPMASVGCY